MLKETDGDKAAVSRAFRLAFGRMPEKAEAYDAVQLWKASAEEQVQLNPKPRTYPTEIIRSANEENTGETFQASDYAA